MSGGPRVALHVGELVMDAAGRIDRHRLAAAAAAELGRLLGEGSVRPAPGVRAAVDAGTVAVPAAGSAAGDASDAVGRRLAQVVHAALGGAR